MPSISFGRPPSPIYTLGRGFVAQTFSKRHAIEKRGESIELGLASNIVPIAALLSHQLHSILNTLLDAVTSPLALIVEC